jgi:hypothetical protein
MKYWICKDSEGIILYCGSVKPFYNAGTNKFQASISEVEDYDWIPANILDILKIKYPKDLEFETCKRIFIDIKSKW